jgi:hypothetical protein
LEVVERIATAGALDVALGWVEPAGVELACDGLECDGLECDGVEGERDGVVPDPLGVPGEREARSASVSARRALTTAWSCCSIAAAWFEESPPGLDECFDGVLDRGGDEAPGPDGE